MALPLLKTDLCFVYNDNNDYLTLYYNWILLISFYEYVNTGNGLKYIIYIYIYVRYIIHVRLPLVPFTPAIYDTRACKGNKKKLRYRSRILEEGIIKY